MAFEDRKALIGDIEKIRDGRRLVCLCNFDRVSKPELPGLTTSFQSDVKEALYRVLKETCSAGAKSLDIFLYTRGGDPNSVLPLVSLIREFDRDFEVLVPFRAHSAGTLFCLGARSVHMTRLAELSPIDPTTGNQFNPMSASGQHLGISVEDVHAYIQFLRHELLLKDDDAPDIQRAQLQPFLQRISTELHPLALGNVHRVHQLISRLAKHLLAYHLDDSAKIDEIVKRLTVQSFSHLHMIQRDEAKIVLGDSLVRDADLQLEMALDQLMRQFEKDFAMRDALFLPRLFAGNETAKDFRFIGGIVESANWGYVFETSGTIRRFSKLPSGVSVQVPPGQPMPLVPGLPCEYNIEVLQQRWYQNSEPKGVTV